jgi:hypothetical protein
VTNVPPPNAPAPVLRNTSTRPSSPTTPASGRVSLVQSPSTRSRGIETCVANENVLANVPSPLPFATSKDDMPVNTRSRSPSPSRSALAQPNSPGPVDDHAGASAPPGDPR